MIYKQTQKMCFYNNKKRNFLVLSMKTNNIYIEHIFFPFSWYIKQNINNDDKIIIQTKTSFFRFFSYSAC